MANEKHDPWALLAAARGSVLQHKERLLDCDHEDDCTCDLAAQKIVLLDRIDAALAEHADSATPVVEWRLGDDCDEDFVYYEAYPDSDTGVDAVRFKDGKWRWTMSREQQGYCDTLDEAKSAALAAARGLK